MKKLVVKFGLIIFLLIVLFQLSQYSYRYHLPEEEWVVILMGLVFIGVGVVLSKLLQSKKGEGYPEISKEKINTLKISEYGISERELDVLQLMAEGLSNKEIGERLFVSESTVKTHASRLFVKLDVKRRTQAVAKAKGLNIII